MKVTQAWPRFSKGVPARTVVALAYLAVGWQFLVGAMWLPCRSLACAWTPPVERALFNGVPGNQVLAVIAATMAMAGLTWMSESFTALGQQRVLRAAKLVFAVAVLWIVDDLESSRFTCFLSPGPDTLALDCALAVSCGACMLAYRGVAPLAGLRRSPSNSP